MRLIFKEITIATGYGPLVSEEKKSLVSKNDETVLSINSNGNDHYPTKSVVSVAHIFNYL